MKPENFTLNKNFVIQETIRVMGTTRTAYGWLNNPRDELDGKKPMELLESCNGCEHVVSILEKIEKE